MTEPNITEPKGVQPVSLDWKFTGKPGYKDFRPIPGDPPVDLDFSDDLDPEDDEAQETDAPDPKLSSVPASVNFSASDLKREAELRAVAEMKQDRPATPSIPTLQSVNHAAAEKEASRDETS